MAILSAQASPSSLHDNAALSIESGREQCEPDDYCPEIAGANEISVFHPDGVIALLDPGSRCSKAPWHDAAWPLSSQNAGTQIRT